MQAYDELAPDGSGLRQLTNAAHHEFFFSGDWSPDGQPIAYVSASHLADHLQIRSMDADGHDEGLIADYDPELFCDVPNWGVYEVALPASFAATRATTRGSRTHLARRAAVKRLRRAVIRRLRGLTR